jgi:hypothetical protein
MPRYEITGGNGRNASTGEIFRAVKAAGGGQLRTRYAFGMRNQPHVVTFAAPDDHAARALCRRAESILWPGDESIMATLLAYQYR